MFQQSIDPWRQVAAVAQDAASADRKARDESEPRRIIEVRRGNPGAGDVGFGVGQPFQQPRVRHRLQRPTKQSYALGRGKFSAELIEPSVGGFDRLARLLRIGRTSENVDELPELDPRETVPEDGRRRTVARRSSKCIPSPDAKGAPRVTWQIRSYARVMFTIRKTPGRFFVAKCVGIERAEFRPLQSGTITLWANNITARSHFRCRCCNKAKREACAWGI
ncbi:hypothetical protein ACFSLT_17260 [Novosphingobium resinovorum]